MKILCIVLLVIAVIVLLVCLVMSFIAWALQGVGSTPESQTTKLKVVGIVALVIVCASICGLIFLP